MCAFKTGIRAHQLWRNPADRSGQARRHDAPDRAQATKAKAQEARQENQLVARFPRGSIVAVSRRGQSRRRLYDAPVSDLFAASRYINRKHGEHLAFPKYVDHLASFAIWTCENANHFSRRNGDPAAPDNRI